MGVVFLHVSCGARPDGRGICDDAIKRFVSVRDIFDVILLFKNTIFTGDNDRSLSPITDNDRSLSPIASHCNLTTTSHMTKFKPPDWPRAPKSPTS